MKLFTLLVAFILTSGGLQITEVRKSYIKAAKSEESAMKFAELVDNVTQSHENKVLVAYKGCALTLKSKYSGYLPDKITFMKEGANFIDGAAEAAPDNIEIRIIRLSVQENVPLIVGYRSNKEEDKAFILNNYDKTPKDIRNYVRNYILQSESFTAAEKKRLKK